MPRKDAGGDTRTPARVVHSQKNKARVVELRMQRMHFEDIGKALDPPVSKARAWQIYQQALAEIPAVHVEEHRAEQLLLIDAAINNLLPVAQGIGMDGRPVANRDRIEAWNTIGKFLEREAKMMGIDAPSQLSITVDSVQAEIDRLMKELEA